MQQQLRLGLVGRLGRLFGPELLAELLRRHHLPINVVQLTRVRPRFDFAVVALVALSVRLLHAWFVSRTPFFAGPVIDAAVNRGLAQQLATTGDTGSAFYQPPLYPAFLSLLYRAGLTSPWSVAVVQSIMGALTAALLVEVGRRLASRQQWRRGAGLLCGLGAALYGPFVLFDLELLPPCCVNLLLVTALLLSLRRAALGPADLALGLASGLAVTAWPPAALFLPVFLLLRARRLPGPRRTLLAVVLCAALVPLAITARYNARHGGAGVVVSYNLGINLWLGNGPHWRETWLARPGAAFEPELERPDRHGATQPAARSAYFVDRVLSEVKQRPLAFIFRTSEKLYYVFAGREIRRDQDIELLREASPVLRTLLWEAGLAFPFGVLVPLGLLAMVRRRNEPDVRSVAVLVAAYAVVLALFFVSSRYRLPLVLLLLPLAADQALFMLTERHQTRAAVLALAAMVLLNLPNRFTARFAASEAERGVLEATAWGNQGQPERASMLAADLVQRFPHDPNVLMLRATQLIDEGDRCRDAEPLLTETIVLAPRTATPRILLASCYESLGQLTAAERSLANALALHPYHPQALRNASLLMERERRPKEAKALAQRFLASGYEDSRLRRIGGL